jgi:excisionase family DNA binding protein
MVARAQEPKTVKRALMTHRQLTSIDRLPFHPASPGSKPGTAWAPGDGLLTAVEVARLLRISRSAVYKLMQRGDLPSLLVGRLRRIRARDVERYLRGRPRRRQRP